MKANNTSRGAALEDHPRFRAGAPRSRHSPRDRERGAAPAVTAPQRSTAPPTPTTTPTLEARVTSSPRTNAGTVRRSSRAVAPMSNRLGLVADAAHFGPSRSDKTAHRDHLNRGMPNTEIGVRDQA